MSEPRGDPQAEAMPYNPCIVGRLRQPPTDSPSLVDHLKAVRLAPPTDRCERYASGTPEPAYAEDD